MKIFVSILSVYLLLLTAIPCCSFDTCPDEDMKKELRQDGSANGQQDCGTCSPFFQCERCATVSLTEDLLSMELITDKAAAIYAEYKHPYIPFTHLEYWRPPQL